MNKVTFDYSLLNVSNQDFSMFEQPVQIAHEQLHNGALKFTDWVDYPMNVPADLVRDIRETADEIASKCTAVVVIGIGGSFLGAKAGYDMMINEFNSPQGRPRLYFAGCNMSATYHARIMKAVKNDDVCLIVVSKSGTTMETSAAFDLFRYFLFEKYRDGYKERIYTVTDAKNGTLRQESEAMGYKAFVLPAGIGGRYSVLTPAGLLPLAVAGLDIAKIIAGARRAYEVLRQPNVKYNDCYKYAVIRRLLYIDGKNVEVFSYNEPQMEYFAEWLKQLFGESEGKGRKGLFPASAMFTRDLHSLGQYLQDGLPVLFESMIRVENPTLDITFRSGMKSYNEMNRIVYEAVARAHSEAGMPVLQFAVEDLSEESFGYLVYFFEKACAMSCILLGVDPFDQPGVEVYKKNVREMLAKQ